MRLLVAVCGCVLLLAVGLQVAAGLLREPKQIHEALGTWIPAGTAVWTMSDQPIAETPEMKKAVGELLNFDDAVFRTYRKGTQRFDVYVAFWQPGKMSERLVAGHTPDVCWVAAGWTKVSREPPDAKIIASADFPARGQYRIFKDPRGSTRWVVFWHKAGGEFVNYASANGLPPWWTVFADIANRGLQPRASQYFVRVSSNVPWEDLARDSEFRAVMGATRAILK